MAPKVFIYTECKLSTKVHIFIWGGFRGGRRFFGVASATPCHPGIKEPPLHLPPRKGKMVSMLRLIRKKLPYRLTDVL